jgi:hypothetical protein
MNIHRKVIRYSMRTMASTEKKAFNMCLTEKARIGNMTEGFVFE